MLGKASAIKARNQVSEHPPLSKLAGLSLTTFDGLDGSEINSQNRPLMALNFLRALRLNSQNRPLMVDFTLM